MSDYLAPVEIAPGTYWVGKRDPESIFHANPYLRVFHGTDKKTGKPNQFNLLIDPGSPSDFAIVSTKVAQVIGNMNRVSALFINHQDPDVGASAPMVMARYAPKAHIVCSEDTWRLVVHQGLPRDRFIATEKATSRGLALPTGHIIKPVPTPYCHFRGAVMLYDPETRVLFTGDLFGGLTEATADGLYADESDWKGMRAFHQIYMPAGAAIRRAVQQIRKLDPAPEILAPQHGRVIRGAYVAEFMHRLENLPCGVDILDEDDKESLDAWNHVLSRVLDLAKQLLGSLAEARLADSAVLQDTLSFDGGRIQITSLGRWTIERALEALTARERAAVTNVLRMEALTAADQLGLPTPRIELEEGEDTESEPSELVGYA
ncbi:MAG: hypothetical protein U0230_02770 [Polyangiales bacterium]